MQRLFTLTLVALLVTVTAGCASRLREDTYSRGQVRHMQSVQTGTVRDVRIVQIEGTKSGVGTAAGGVIGGVVSGSNVGGGSGSVVSSVIGSILGGFIGSTVEEGITRQDGQEVVVELDSGKTIAVVQEMIDGKPLRLSQRVRVINGRKGARVVPAN